jgi:Helix-turn-helix
MFGHNVSNQRRRSCRRPASQRGTPLSTRIPSRESLTRFGPPSFLTLHPAEKFHGLCGLSLEQLAARSKIDKPVLSRLEAGKQSNPNLAPLIKYARALE